MRPFFTSRSEWNRAALAGERAYVREALGHVVSASLLAFFVLVGPIGATDPYWRSLPVLASFALSLAGGVVFSVLLFSREWRAALSTYGPCCHGTEAT